MVKSKLQENSEQCTATLVDHDPHTMQCIISHSKYCSHSQLYIHRPDWLNKRTMMVLYCSPEYKAVQVSNEDKYQIDF